MRDTFKKLLKPLNIHILLHLQNLLEYFELFEAQSTNLWTRHYSLDNLSPKSQWISRMVSIRDKHDKCFKYLIKRQLSLMQTGIKQINNGLNGIHKCKLGIGVDGDDDIQYVCKLGVTWYSLIFANVNESFVDPVTYTFEGISFMVTFEYLGFEQLEDALWEIGEIVVYVLVGHLL